MKKVLFLVSHLASGSDQLYKQLDQTITVQGFQNDIQNSYYSSWDIMALTNQKHKHKTTSRIYMDHLLYNFQFCCRDAYSSYKFLYVIREPEETVESLISQKTFSKSYAIRYYLYRLRRICEMMKNSKDYLFVTYNKLKANHADENIRKFLSIKEKWSFEPTKINAKIKNQLNFRELQHLNSSYEKYLYFIHNLGGTIIN